MRIDVELYLALVTFIVAMTLDGVDRLPIGAWEWPLALVLVAFIGTVATLAWREMRRW